ncbi:MAG: dTDP-4-dehydrorhamnose reductase [Bacteriovoracia bacterium]
MRVLVFGASGQLGKKILETAPAWAELAAFSRVDVDVSSMSSLAEVFNKHQPSIVINCAAYTAVDKAEVEADLAYLINQEAVDFLAKLCLSHNAFLVHYSTDYVFSGNQSSPYTETSPLSPMNVYGKSKAQGELKIQQSGCFHAIIRTSWLYGEHGKNFLHTIATKLASGAMVKVVADQIGSPTYVGDLAAATWELLADAKHLKMKEIFHYSNEGVASWYDFAFEIGILSQKSSAVLPIRSDEYPTPARRPPYSVFDKSKIKTKLKSPIRHWKLALKESFIKYQEIHRI